MLSTSIFAQDADSIKVYIANVEKTGKKSVRINLDPVMLSDIENKEKKENDFRITALILSMSAALDFDKKNKNKSEAELFAQKFATVCSSMAEVKEDNTGFYWEYYAPYFIKMKEADLITTFSYLVYATSEDKDVQQWLDKNEDKIESFYKWSSDYEWEVEK